MPPPTDDRITIRLTPRQLRAHRRIIEAFHQCPNIAALLGLRSEELEVAATLLERLPLIVPSPAYAEASAGATDTNKSQSTVPQKGDLPSWIKRRQNEAFEEWAAGVE